jgi:hypothetical protein
VHPPLLDHDLCLSQRIENLSVQAFVPRLPVEAFTVAILPGTPRFDSFGWIYRLFGVEEYVIEVSYSSLFRADLVTEANIEKWFTYLISGFDRALAPSVPLNDGIPAARQLGKQTAPIAEA